MAWMWARLKARTTHLGTFQGGFQAFADQFTAVLQGMGVNLNLNSPVESNHSLTRRWNRLLYSRWSGTL